MTKMEQARRLAAAGRSADYVALVAGAAAARDPDALFEMAQWRLLGSHGPRDLAEAHRLLDQAGAAGHVEAVQLKAILVCNGTGCPSDPAAGARLLRRIERMDGYAALQLAFAEKLRTPSQVRQLPLETLSAEPSIHTIRKLLTPEECGYIRAMAGPLLQPSFVVEPHTGRRIPHPVRTSSGMSFGPMSEDQIVHAINRRLAQVTGTQVDWGEPLHVLRYDPGQEYRPHIDALPGEANQRHWTVLVYLNEEYEGGATRFDLAGVEFRGAQGDALIFRNVLDSGAADLRSRHAGLPVSSGTKWLATRWIRQARYHPWEASGP